jgi:hypothetical protein
MRGSRLSLTPHLSKLEIALRKISGPLRNLGQGALPYSNRHTMPKHSTRDAWITFNDRRRDFTELIDGWLMKLNVHSAKSKWFR